MKYFLSVVLAISICSAWAHQEKQMFYKQGNVYLWYLSGYDEYEIHPKLKQLVYFTDKLLTAKKYSENVYIHFKHDYMKRYDKFYGVSYDDYMEWQLDSIGDSIAYVPRKGIIIDIRDSDIELKPILNLIDGSFKNLEYVKCNTYIYALKQPSFNMYDSLTSISIKKVIMYSEERDPVIDSLLSQKVYRSITKAEFQGDVDYYLKDGKYHFYDTREPLTEWSVKNRKYEVEEIYGQDLLVIDNVFEIVGDYPSSSHFVFVDEKTFYYFPAWFSSPIQGPFVIDSVPYWRPSIHEYNLSHYPMERYFFSIFDNWMGRTQQVQFFPKYGLLISNYQNYENGFISDLVDEKLGHRKGPSITTRIMILLVGVSILVNIALWSKRD